MLEDEIKLSANRIFIATDDGSKGTKGFVSDVFKNCMAPTATGSIWRWSSAPLL